MLKVYNLMSLLALFLLLGCELFEKKKAIFDRCTLSYGTGIVYPSDNPADSVLLPNIQQQKGLYVAEPDGLVIDNYTGKINLDSSLYGHEYRIRYISRDNKYFCETDLILSGIDYEDGVYDLDKGQTTAVPFYNASRQNPVPTDGRDNIFRSTDQRLFLTNGGVIDLKETVATGLIPKNSRRPTPVTIFYQLDDQSNRALNRITVYLYYYTDPIPEDLLKQLERKREYPKNGRAGKFLDHDPPDIVVKDEI